MDHLGGLIRIGTEPVETVSARYMREDYSTYARRVNFCFVLLTYYDAIRWDLSPKKESEWLSYIYERSIKTTKK